MPSCHLDGERKCEMINLNVCLRTWLCLLCHMFLYDALLWGSVVCDNAEGQCFYSVWVSLLPKCTMMSVSLPSLRRSLAVISLQMSKNIWEMKPNKSTQVISFTCFNVNIVKTKPLHGFSCDIHHIYIYSVELILYMEMCYYLLPAHVKKLHSEID